MAVRFHIPKLGTAFVLREDWDFRLYREGRNKKLIDALFNIKENNWIYSNIYDKIEWKVDEDKKLCYVNFMLKAGTILFIDRIYVRKGAKDFDSITFRTGKKTPNGKQFDSKRFWARLRDANDIICDIIG